MRLIHVIFLVINKWIFKAKCYFAFNTHLRVEWRCASTAKPWSYSFMSHSVSLCPYWCLESCLTVIIFLFLDLILWRAEISPNYFEVCCFSENYKGLTFEAIRSTVKKKEHKLIQSGFAESSYNPQINSGVNFTVILWLAFLY